MLDIRYILENKTRVEKDARNKNIPIDIEMVCSLYEEWRTVRQELEQEQQLRNQLAKQSKSPEEATRKKAIETGKQIKQKIQALQGKESELHHNWNEALKRVPNIIDPAVPIGKGEEDNTVIAHRGDKKNFSFSPKNHLQLMQERDLIDFDAGTKTSGTKFYFLKNQAVILELALIRYALDIAQTYGYSLYQTPDLAKQDIVESLGYSPRSDSPDIYRIEQEDLCLVGTAEITLGGYFADSILSHEQLPIRMVGLSHCFRKEAGAAGKYSRGLYRVHQFTKVELFSFTDEHSSDDELERLRSIEESLFQGLEIPFRVVEACTGELSAPTYKKYDLEAWMPGRDPHGAWGEITSTSNCRDFQSRRLKIRYRNGGESKSTTFVHTLNGTAVATSRAMIALIENHQQEDGSIVIPKALQPYTGFTSIPA